MADQISGAAGGNAGNGQQTTPPTDLAGEIGQGPGEDHAGVGAIAAAVAFQVVMMVVLIYTLVAFWPQPTPAMSHTERDRILALRDGGEARTDSAPASQSPRQVQADTPATTGAPKGSPPATPTPPTQGSQEQTGATGTEDTDGAANTAARQREDAERHARQIIPGPGVVGVPGFYRCTALPETALWIVHADDVLDPQCVRYLDRVFPISNEQRLVLIVLLSGALGALLYGLRSLRWYVGTRYLKKSWVLQYFVGPFMGALLAYGIYAVLRGGFFNPSSDVSDTSPVSFAAAAFLVGLFNEEAIEKLREIANAFFTPKPRGPEKAPESGSTTTEITTETTTETTTTTSDGGVVEDGDGPDEEGDAWEDDAAGAAPGGLTITGVTVVQDAGGADMLDIRGTGFTSATQVEVDHDRRAPQFHDDTYLTLALTSQEVAKLEALSTLEVVVVTPGSEGGRSPAVAVP